jgi:hypothetical protein
LSLSTTIGKSTLGEIKPLIAIPSPRDIAAVKQNLDSIENVPKLWVKYFREGDAYKIIQSYFLEHPEFNYLIISPDDLIVRKHDYDRLVQTIIDNGGPSNIPTLSAVCNVIHFPAHRTQLAICLDQEIDLQRRRRKHVWVDLRSRSWKDGGYDNMDLLKVKFTGFAFQFIRRDIVQEIGLQGDKKHNPDHMIQEDYSFDTVFSYMCNHHEPQPIPIYVNPKVRLLHLRGANKIEYPGIEPLLVGKKERRVEYVDENNKSKTITKQCVDQYLVNPEEQEGKAAVEAVPPPATAMATTPRL